MMLHKLDDIVAVDWETYYAADYSLSLKKYSTSSYVRDEQFLPHGVGIKEGRKKTVWYDAKKGVAKLKSIDWKRKAMLAHHAHFDGFIMTDRFGLRPHFYYDTLSMTRALHAEVSRANLDTIAKFYGVGEKSKTYLVQTKGKRTLTPAEFKHLGEGCVIDIDLMWDIFLKQVEVFPEKELRLVDLTVRMFTDPVLNVDEPRAAAALKLEQDTKERLIKRAKVPPEVLSSNEKFAAKLREFGVEPPTKISLRTGHETYAFAQSDLEFLDLLDHEDVRVRRLMAARIAAKSTIEEARASRLLAAGKDGRKLPIYLNFSGAKTHRWSGGDKMNAQNLPRAEYDDKGVYIEGSDALRRSIIAPSGHVIVVVDSSQIELRVNNKLAGATDKLQRIRDYDAKKGPDPYRLLAAEVYSKNIDEISKPERFVGKVGELGLGYQMGALKFQTTLAIGSMGPPVDLPLATCRRVVNVYRNINRPIVQQWATFEGILTSLSCGEEGQYQGILEWGDSAIWGPNGLGLHYPDLRPYFAVGRNGEPVRRGFTYYSYGARRKIYGGLATENAVQFLARIIVGEQMLRIADKYRVVMMTHDEVACCVPKKQAEKALEFMFKEMKTPPAWWPDLPLNAEGGFDVCYSK